MSVVSGQGIGAGEVADGDLSVRYEVTANGVAMLTLNRPERRNAWGPALARAFYAAVDRADADPAARVLLVTGAGKAFCAGADMGSAESAGSLEDGGAVDIAELVGGRVPDSLTRLRKPVVAAINGACAGFGLTLALMCDVRFASAGAKFATAFARRGLIAEHGISWILPRLVGWGVATDLMLSGRTFLAEEALELGLVKRVVEQEQLLPVALEYAEDIALQCSPASLAQIKGQLYGDAGRGIGEATARAETLMNESLTRPDVIEGITAFFEKRRPNFPPLE
ncbi:enoyl-CoA hydratase [Aldersonia sp. NBC_00410]|uniref:enoyl-CoA hydratase n=1 Tax=Aldersonia sp. NBC_00410 TaxID=2975954 RepID=UPI00224CFF40|nr:enoyl-CoA hydratase [Aldersonia sp. NBC_00410]MCX5045364.1 enoyl-CoA hydratase [Aldersonia sp. NBC_00410]